MDAKTWSDMFYMGMPVLESILRPVIVYFFLVLCLRLAGKRELSQLNPFDLVVLLVLSNTVQNSIIGGDNSVTGGLIAAATLLLLNHLVVRFLSRHKKMDELVEGKPVVLIDGGKLIPESLKEEVITREELEAAAHKQGFASLDEVERAVFEPGGALTLVAKVPEPEVERHRELLERLDALTREVAQLKPAV